MRRRRARSTTSQAVSSGKGDGFNLTGLRKLPAMEHGELEVGSVPGAVELFHELSADQLNDPVDVAGHAVVVGPQRHVDLLRRAKAGG